MKAQSEIIQFAVFGSGKGSNARKLAEYFRHHPHFGIGVLLSNKPDAGFDQIAQDFHLPCLALKKAHFDMDLPILLGFLKQHQIQFIVLAGFLWKLPEKLIQLYPDKIINIHPSLLPDFGGKGMYGMKVHDAVVQSGNNYSGITIHLVNEHYDDGRILKQFKIHIPQPANPETLAQAIHELEHQHFSKTVEEYLHFNTFGQNLKH